MKLSPVGFSAMSLLATMLSAAPLPKKRMPAADIPCPWEFLDIWLRCSSLGISAPDWLSSMPL